MYSSNQAKQKKYLKLRAEEEANEEAQQALLDEYLANERGFETNVSSLGRLASRVAKKIQAPIELNQSNFSDIISKIIKLDPSLLSSQAKAVWSNLSEQSYRDQLNKFMVDELHTLKTGGTSDAAATAVVFDKLRSMIFGSTEVEKEILDKLAKTSLSIIEPKKIDKAKQAAVQELLKREASAKERSLMENEDFDISDYRAEQPPIGPAPSDVVIDIGAWEDDVNKLKLLSDLVKYSKDNTVIDIAALDRLPNTVDYDTRVLFNDVLNEMKSTLTKRAKDEADKKAIEKIQSYIEKSRLADAFQKLEDNRILANNALASKLQRNLKQLMIEKKLNRRIADKAAANRAQYSPLNTSEALANAIERKTNKIPINNKANKALIKRGIIQSRLNDKTLNLEVQDLINEMNKANKVAKSASSSRATSLMSDMDTQTPLDWRHLNPGARRKEIDEDKKMFRDAMEIIADPSIKGRQRKKAQSNITNVITRFESRGDYETANKYKAEKAVYNRK